MTDTTAESAGRAWWAQFALFGAIIAAVLLVSGPLGYRLGILGVQGAVLFAPGMATALAIVVLAFALIGGIIALRRGLRAERAPLLVGGLVALLIVGNMGMQFSRASSVPPIHDITTAPEDPPRFDAVLARRGSGTNSLEYDAADLATPTRTAYPGVQPILSDRPPAESFAQALAAVRALGWELVAQDADAGRIEATEESMLYGFKDDVVIRVRPEGSGSRIDLRSASRVGQSDLGANAARIERFIERFGAP
ncbi:MAG: DUF1499 domain-containing protein [Pseudomonadales bacterium]|jgi:hypothetical protein|nr:DUF1499 domain-containing protein [Pseudomonadales bacterium]